jgi:hypothetical protein
VPVVAVVAVVCRLSACLEAEAVALAEAVEEAVEQAPMMTEA